MRGTLFWFLVIVMSCHHAQLLGEGRMGTVEGYVRTTAGKGIPAAKLVLRSEAPRGSFSTITDSKGNYRVTAPVGTYRVEVTRQGYAAATEPQLMVGGHSHLRLNFVLKPSLQGRFSKSAGPSLSAIHFYEPSRLKAGQLTDPAAGGGYSNSATIRSREMIKAYLSKPGFPEAHAPRLANSGATTSPLTRLQTLAQEEPTEANFQRWGSVLLARQKYALAAHVFQQGLARYSGSARLWTGLGISLYSQGRYNQAVQALIHAAQIDPSNPQVYDFLGDAYHPGSRAYGAVAGLLQQFMRLQPRNADAHYDYAMILWRRPLTRQSPALLRIVESQFKTAIALDPQFPEAYFQLGVLYDQEKITRVAITQYQMAVRLRPGFAKAHYRLAQDYLRVGERAQATTELGVYEKSARQAEGP
jgi:tetratricopeptide (TPR) repeat protein